MNAKQLFERIQEKRSYLCIGLDTDPDKIPDHLRQHDDPVYEFNKAIIDATADLCVAYKPNLAFYEAAGESGWSSLRRTLTAIPPHCMVIADAKRGDIGNTSALYARAFFDQLGCDAITVAPYMGEDSVTPFLSYPGKWVILLALTSNKGALDFQIETDTAGVPLYEKVMRKAMTWAGKDQLMFVCGATRAEQFLHLRTIAPDYFFLVPGVGAQGGDLQAISRTGMNEQCGLLVNSSRQIIFASGGKDFAEAARAEALKLRDEMDALLREKGL